MLHCDTPSPLCGIHGFPIAIDFFFSPTFLPTTTINIPRLFTQHTYCTNPSAPMVSLPPHPAQLGLSLLPQHSSATSMNWAYTLIKSLNDLISSSGTVFTTEFFILTVQMIFLIVCVQQLLWLLIVIIPSLSCRLCTPHCLCVIAPIIALLPLCPPPWQIVLFILSTMLLMVSVPLIASFSVIALWPLCLHCLVVFVPFVTL